MVELTLQIRVLNEHPRGRNRGQGGADGGPLATIGSVMEEADTGVSDRPGEKLVPCSVHRGIIHDEHFSYSGLGEDTVKQSLNRISLIINGDDDGQTFIGRG